MFDIIDAWCDHEVQGRIVFPKWKRVCDLIRVIQDDTKKRELLKNPTKIEEIQEKNLLKKLNHYSLPFKRQ